jgi:hypothetical protein
VILTAHACIGGPKRSAVPQDEAQKPFRRPSIPGNAADEKADGRYFPAAGAFGFTMAIAARTTYRVE